MPRKPIPKPVLSPKQKLFLEWLVTPPDLRSPSTQREWCAQNHVATKTATHWRKDPEFRRAWDARLTELQIDPERIDQIMQALYAKASAGSEKAISMYLDVVREFRPPPEVDPRELRGELTDLSDEDLEAMIQAHVHDEIAARQAARDDAALGDDGASAGDADG